MVLSTYSLSLSLSLSFALDSRLEVLYPYLSIIVHPSASHIVFFMSFLSSSLSILRMACPHRLYVI